MGKNYKDRNKGECLLSFKDDFVVFDLETTGFNYKYGDIIEIGAIKVKNNEIVDVFETFVRCNYNIPSKIVNLTGITNEMLLDAPNINEALDNFKNFIEDKLLVAHNAHFDINFIYDAFEEHCNIEFDNNFLDTLRISRLLFRDFKTHRLNFLSEKLDFTNKPSHRSLSDCYATLELYYKCKEKCLENNIDLSNRKQKNNNSKKYSRFKPSDLIPEKNKLNDNHILFEKECVFTGTLLNFTRKEAMQKIINIGGTCNGRVTKSSNYLIMGVQDYGKFVDGKESSKTKKAKKFISEGQDLKIIHEDDFIKLLKGEYIDDSE